MTTLTQAEKAQRGAGIIGLAFNDINVSPHHILIKKEREFITNVLKDSITGLRELAEKSGAVVSSFDALKTVLQEGRAFFINGEASIPENLDRIHALRVASYETGRTKGFEKILKLVRKKLLDTETIGGESFQKGEFEAALIASHQLELRRVAAVHRVSTALNDCLARLAKDKHLQIALCALAKCEDHDGFIRARREETQTSTRNLFEWVATATTVQTAFCPELTFEGWFSKLNRLGALFETTSASEIQLSKPIGELLSPRRRSVIASGVPTALDEIAQLARHYTALVESPIKDVYRINFLLGELEKELPHDVADSHRKQLAVVTSRFITDSDSLVYTIGVEQDELFSSHERARFLDHIKATIDTIETRPVRQLPSVHAPEFKRTDVRRERREEIQLEKASEAKEELLQRILEIKEAAPAPRAQTESTLLFFPARLEQEFATWTDTFPEHTRAGVKALLYSAARGERVDFKPINIEKKIFELRMLGCGYRIYCTRSKDNELVVLAFGPKESQKQDILTAHGRFRHFCAGSEPA
jgi:putative addiction module killer protein